MYEFDNKKCVCIDCGKEYTTCHAIEQYRCKQCQILFIHNVFVATPNDRLWATKYMWVNKIKRGSGQG